MRSAILAVAAVLALATAGGAQLAPDSPSGRPRLVSRRATSPITLDGTLDEPDWRAAPVIDGFQQVEPELGVPSRFRTVVRVLFDGENLYIGYYGADALGAAGVRLQDFRRDFEYGKNDQIGVTIDAIGDGKYNAAFSVSPYGTQRDVEAFDGGLAFNDAYDPLWRAAAERTDSGWTAELAIPWSSLRYVADGRPWHMNFYRLARRTNEQSGWVGWPRNFQMHRAAYSGEVTGIEPPPPARNLRVRPYTIGEAMREGVGARYGEPIGRFGGDVSWAPTPNAVLDVTANTDFAQADVDRQVVNLRRFSVFFPERRPFFQENSALFGPGLGSPDDATFVIRPYFSRRIGLDASGNPVPIDAGARFVYRGEGRQFAGLVLRQSPSAGGALGTATFGVMRYSHNLGVSGRAGGLVALRLDDPTGATAATQSVVASADFFRRLSDHVSVEAFVSGSGAQGAGTAGGQSAYAALAYETPSLSIYTTGAVVGKGYDPPTGFVSRTDAAMTRLTVRHDWRPAWRPEWLRRFDTYTQALAFMGPSDGRLQEATLSWSTAIEFQSGALIVPALEYSAQRPQAPFAPVGGVSIPAGSYDQVRGGITLQTDPSQGLAAGVSVTTGGYFDRTLTSLQVTGRFSPSPRLAVEGTYIRSDFSGAGPAVRTNLAQPGVRLGITTRMNLSAFYQHNTDLGRGALNVRYAWEFQPLSYVFLIFNDGTNLVTPAPPGALPPRQQVVLKFSWLAQL